MQGYNHQGKDDCSWSCISVIDEIEIDSPVPFNIPLEFEGEPQYGEHDIKITVRYKDNVRDEIFLPYETTIFVEEPQNDEESEDNTMMYIIPVIIAIAIGVIVMRRRKKEIES